jgi:hypothetical protein
MKQDLETLKSEILEHLESRNFVVFHAHSRLADSLPMVHWDSVRYPDYKQFLETAKQAEVKIIVFHHRELSSEVIDETLDRLENCDMPREDHRNLQRRLSELRVYEGFACALELAYDYEGRVYIFSLHTDWFDELLDIADEINDYLIDEEDEEEEEGPMGGYFSRN